MAEKLGAGAEFPPMSIEVVDGAPLTIPGALDSRYTIVLFYRGHW